MKRIRDMFDTVTGLMVLSAFILLGCGDSSERQYAEEVHESTAHHSEMPEHANMQQNEGMKGDPHTEMAAEMSAGEAPPAHPYQWSLPAGWKETGKRSMLRMETFEIADAPELSCAVFGLNGTGGGLAANVSMWTTQIDLTLSDDEIESFLSKQEAFQTEEKLSGKFIDFSDRVKGDEAKCMFVAALQLEQQVLFIKLSGPKAKMQNKINDTKALAKSLTVSK